MFLLRVLCGWRETDVSGVTCKDRCIRLGTSLFLLEKLEYFNAVVLWSLKWTLEEVQVHFAPTEGCRRLDQRWKNYYYY